VLGEGKGAPGRASTDKKGGERGKLSIREQFSILRTKKSGEFREPASRDDLRWEKLAHLGRKEEVEGRSVREAR